MRKIQEVLENRNGNYILPFYWQHGEDEATLREGMKRIHEAGIGAVCVESRPHPEYVGPKWWEDMDIILDEAKKRDMKVWILDDAHFPTGYLNGRLAEFPQARKQLVVHYCIDVVGPTKGTSFVIKLEDEEKLLGVVAARRDRKNKESMADLVDISDHVQGQKVYWDAPEGLWSVVIIKTTYKGRDRQTHGNMIDRATVRLLLDICYEPHWEHYKDEFGKTIAGFFSDEPQMGNSGGASMPGIAQMGNLAMPLSWCGEMEENLKEQWGPQFLLALTACWYEVKDMSPAARLSYMDNVSKLFEVNFSQQLGDWCREHGVEYIGHIIEDNGSHARLGHGPAHFFRSLWGQDMSGIDVVLQQIRPGLEDTEFYRIDGQAFYNGKLFHNILAKMGSSLGHMDPKKKGRTMCEIFGAYGWSEGLKMMKWLTDHMLVRGINWYVPHAFTMKDFHDPDCPPHFYARGNNPQYPYFKYVMNYMNRVSHLISDGRHVPMVALLYSAEGEWMDYKTSQPLEEVALELNRAQIDYEIVPEDVLVTCRAEDGTFMVGGEKMQALIISARGCISERMYHWCEEAAACGVPVYFVDGQPKVVQPLAIAESVLPEKPVGCVIGLEELVPELKGKGMYEIECDSAQPYLRYYHYVQNDGDLILFFNEDPVNAIDTWVKVPMNGEVCWYDAFDNVLRRAEVDGDKVKLTLTPYQALVLCNDQNGAFAPEVDGNAEVAAELKEWQLTLMPAGKDDLCVVEEAELVNLAAADQYQEFSGTMIYETTVIMTEKYKTIAMDLGDVYETAEVWVNGVSVGVRVAPPYTLIIDGDVFVQGENDMKIVVVNTLGHQQSQQDRFGMTLPQEPVGLLGPVVIKGVK
ncbi:MAG: hypothetical protein IJ315_09800 [Firmicutes bacterium]|nr:hypothetical protein [Bacillota bacterium]